MAAVVGARWQVHRGLSGPQNGGTLEKAQLMAAHASTRTTQLYDRRSEEVSLDEVERIVI